MTTSSLSFADQSRLWDALLGLAVTVYFAGFFLSVEGALARLLY
jgi:hypothetical protein